MGHENDARCVAWPSRLAAVPFSRAGGMIGADWLSCRQQCLPCDRGAQELAPRGLLGWRQLSGACLACGRERANAGQERGRSSASWSGQEERTEHRGVSLLVAAQSTDDRTPLGESPWRGKLCKNGVECPARHLQDSQGQERAFLALRARAVSRPAITAGGDGFGRHRLPHGGGARSEPRPSWPAAAPSQ